MITNSLQLSLAPLIYLIHKKRGAQQILQLTLNTYYASLAFLLNYKFKNQVNTRLLIFILSLNVFINRTDFDYTDKTTITMFVMYFVAVHVFYSDKYEDFVPIITSLNALVLLAYIVALIGIRLTTNKEVYDNTVGKFSLTNGILTRENVDFARTILPHFVTTVLFMIHFSSYKRQKWTKKNEQKVISYTFRYCVITFLWYVYDQRRLHSIMISVIRKIYDRKTTPLRFLLARLTMEDFRKIQEQKLDITYDFVDDNALRIFKEHIRALYSPIILDRLKVNPQNQLQKTTILRLISTGKDIYGKEDFVYGKDVNGENIVTSEAGKFITAISPASTPEFLKQYIRENPGHFLRYYRNCIGKSGYDLLRKSLDSKSKYRYEKPILVSLTLLGLSKASFQIMKRVSTRTLRN